MIDGAFWRYDGKIETFLLLLLLPKKVGEEAVIGKLKRENNIIIALAQPFLSQDLKQINSKSNNQPAVNQQSCINKLGEILLPNNTLNFESRPIDGS